MSNDYDKITIESFLNTKEKNDSNNISNDSYEIKLDKEIEDNCDFKNYVDNLEVEEKSNEDLIILDKQDIIDFKDLQISKYKAYINSLEKEKQDLIENFKETTNILLERIKELEQNQSGCRPQTAMILNDIDKNISNKKLNIQNYQQIDFQTLKEDNNINNKLKNKNLHYNNTNNNSSERCVKCKKYYPKDEFAKHSLECLRKPMIVCKICKENIDITEKENHIKMFRDINGLLKSINSNDIKLFKNYLKHGFDINICTNKDNGNYLIHDIVQNNNTELFEVLMSFNPKVDLLNNLDESALFISSRLGNCKILNKLIENGANINLKNKEGETPLFVAVRNIKYDIILILLKKGSDTNVKNVLGESIINICHQIENEDIENALLMHKSTYSSKQASNKSISKMNSKV